MKTTTSLLFVATITLAVAQNKPANDKKDNKWNVSNPPANSKQIEFTTNEGTWLNLDVSPDGNEILFDMLGDIYALPITGGEAKVLKSGLAFEVQPRYSADGKKISFTSDAGGGDNIWTMNRDGSDAKQLTKENFRLLNNAVWMPNGEYLVARKHFTSARSLGAGEMWMYHKSGGEGIQLTKRKNDQQDAGEPCVSPDGKYIYYSEDMYPGGHFQYNKNVNDQIYVIKRYDLEKGETETIIGGNGGAVRPQISRDGKLLAFVKRVQEKSVLYVHNLETAEEWPIYDKLSKDQQEAWAIFGVYTNFNWSVDNKSIVIWAQGKFWKIDIATLIATEIPFTVKATHTITDAIQLKQTVFAEQYTAKMIRHAVTSPDEKILVFNAAGYLWKKELPNGIPKRLTNSKDFEFEPSFSSNGNEMLYVTWNDEEMGAIYKLNVKSGSKPIKITTEKAIYRTPAFSPDGTKVVYQKEEGNDHQGSTFCINPGLYWIPTAGGKPTLIIKEGAHPVFSNNGQRIFFQSNEGENNALKSATLAGNEVRVLCTSKYANRFVVSNDNKWIAFNELHKAYIAAFPETGTSIDLTANTTAVPIAQLTNDAGINLHWSGDSKKIHWTLGDEYFTNDINKRYTFLPGSIDSIAPLDSVGIKINLQIPIDKPAGVIAFKGARIITMQGDQVIENATIVIKENKIDAVGKVDEIQIPAGATIIDVSGKTIMPGIVDVHAHLGTFRLGLSPQKHWPYYANLAYGVTTTHDPSSNTEMVFSQAEMVKAGYMVGPRIFSTGTILYGADGDFKAVINNLADAKSAVKRTQAFGAFSVKSYNQPRREQRQQVIQAARELGVMVYPEGGSTFFHNMTMILDGHTGVEHNIPVATAYNDVVKLWSSSKTGYTPTLIVSYGAVNGENYWYQKTNVWENKRLLTFTPRSIIDARSRHRTMIPDAEFENGHIQVAKTCKKLADAGVKINLGSHGQLQGLGAHWELWMLAQGGMSNMQVLRCATMNGAEYIGMSAEIGSLEKGKLADLIVLDKNPLEDIRNSEAIKYVMVNGRLYDADNMNEMGNYTIKRSKFYWENNKYNASFPWHEKPKAMKMNASRGEAMHNTSAALYKTLSEKIVIESLSIELLRVTNSDELYEQLVQKGPHNDAVKDEQIPYWCDLWPSAIALATHTVKAELVKQNLKVLEIGCGLGLPGIVAGKLGANVTLTDYLPEALEFAKQNWSRNNATDANFQLLDWRNLPNSLTADILLASDVAYETKSFSYLLNAFKALLNPKGIILMSEPKRIYASGFFELLKNNGFKYSTTPYSINFNQLTTAVNVYEIVRSTTNFPSS